jgi:hypothetical protein
MSTTGKATRYVATQEFPNNLVNQNVHYHIHKSPSNTFYISLTNFMGTPNCMMILYSTSLLTESYTFLMSMISWCTVSLHSQFVLQYQTNAENLISSWSITSRPALMVPNNFSAMYGLDLDKMRLSTSLHDVGSSAITINITASFVTISCELVQ